MQDKQLSFCLICLCFLSLFFVLKVGNAVTAQCSGSRCGECFVSGPICRWCEQNTFNGTRCGEETDLVADGCLSENVVKQPNSSAIFDKDNELQDGINGSVPVQLKPQEINVKLVPNKAYNLKFKYRVAKNFPVDIYFLVDPSYTMRTLREKLADLANDIANSISKLTNDYRFGYGTAMDKVILPFTHTTKTYLNNPCPNDAEKCAPSHSFLHRLNLTANVTAFKEAVSVNSKTANRDKTEGMFDGMMQVLVCTDIIGWRSQARKILLYTSDSDFHFAGDGKFAGIVKPHDFGCHLERMGNYLKYTHDTLLDYPSAGQIRQKLVEKNINAIFVISSAGGVQLKKYYETLNLPGSYTQELGSDAGNILNIIRDTYERLRRTVKFVSNPLENIDMEFKTSCNGRHNFGPRNMCENITVGEEIEFDFLMNLTITKCPEDPKNRFVRTLIHPEGIEDNIVVNIDYVCDCGCQEEGIAVENATQCSTNGRFECGVCHCYDGFIGSTCNCDVSKSIEETCGQVKDGQTIICSNVGQCKCGKCECPSQYTGSFCECDNGACGGYISSGHLCSGNGVCKCGMCGCVPGFNGTTCDCPTSVDTCTDSKSNTSLCSDHGQCICGKCVCNTNYRGDYCQDCPTCKGCEDNRDCASCVGFERGPLNSFDCSEQCSHVAKVEEIQVNTNVTQCQFKDSDGCTVEFTYVDEGGLKLRVEVKSTRKCPAGKPSATVLAAGVSGSIVLVGVVSLIIWKLITMWMDREEYNQFEAEKKRIQFDDEHYNEEYVSPIQDFPNPMYNNQDKEPHVYEKS